jgi:glycosyltransferase involved in cell wall biosynthesis
MSDKNKFHCLYVGDVGSDYRTGGGHTYARNLLLQLTSLDNIIVTPVVYQSNRDRGTVVEMVSNLTGNVAPAIIINTRTYGIGKPLVDIYAGLTLRRLLKRIRKVDCVIFDQPNIVQYLLPNIPSIVMFHGQAGFMHNSFSFRHPRSSFYGGWQRMLLTGLYLRYMKLQRGYYPLFNSHDTLSHLVCDLALSKKEHNELLKYVSWLAVDTELFQYKHEARFEMRKKYSIADDEVVIIYLSNFVSSMKRGYLTPVLLESISQNQKVKLFFIGAGGNENSGPVDDFCKTHVNAFRIFEIAPSEVPAWYSMADIAISFSDKETFGFTVVEGMACKLPTVVFAMGALKEHIVNGVNGIAANSNQEFMDGLAMLVNSSELRKKLGTAARKSVLDNYSFSSFKNKLQAVIKDVMVSSSTD